jgi:Holliday junction resolvasome RuvABC DNA-binding subunit
LDLRPKFEKVYPLNEAISDASPVLEDLKSALLNLNYPTVQVNGYIEEMKEEAKKLTFDELLRGAIARFTF